MPLSAKEMVDTILTAMQANPVGIVSITIDGQTVQYSSTQAQDTLKFWEKRALRENGGRPRSMQVDLSKGFGSL
jgi:hypothetical protein